MRANACPGPQQIHQRITRGDGVAVGAGVATRTAPIQFSGRDARKPEPRAFRAPDRAIAIPDMGGSAGEGLACRDDRDLQGQEQIAEHHWLGLPRFAQWAESRLENMEQQPRTWTGILACPNSEPQCQSGEITIQLARTIEEGSTTPPLEKHEFDPFVSTAIDHLKWLFPLRCKQNRHFSTRSQNSRSREVSLLSGMGYLKST